MDTIIGLIGAKASGKTTAYKAIKEKFPNIVEITLAGKLKDVCAEVSEIPRNWFESHKFKEKELEEPFYLTVRRVTDIFQRYSLDPEFDKFIRPHIGKILFSPREIAQYVGTEILRNFQDNIHCASAIPDQEGKIGVVTDIRFPNELDFFQDKFPYFYAIYIKNQGAEKKATQDQHLSESHLPTLIARCDYTTKDTGIHEFQQDVLRIVSEILRV